MQMLHQQLSFSVGGLFNLDPALLQAVINLFTFLVFNFSTNLVADYLIENVFDCRL